MELIEQYKGIDINAELQGNKWVFTHSLGQYKYKSKEKGLQEEKKRIDAVLKFADSNAGMSWLTETEHEHDGVKFTYVINRNTSHPFLIKEVQSIGNFHFNYDDCHHKNFMEMLDVIKNYIEQAKFYPIQNSLKEIVKWANTTYWKSQTKGDILVCDLQKDHFRNCIKLVKTKGTPEQIKMYSRLIIYFALKFQEFEIADVLDVKNDLLCANQSINDVRKPVEIEKPDYNAGPEKLPSLIGGAEDGFKQDVEPYQKPIVLSKLPLPENTSPFLQTVETKAQTEPINIPIPKSEYATNSSVEVSVRRALLSAKDKSTEPWFNFDFRKTLNGAIYIGDFHIEDFPKSEMPDVFYLDNWLQEMFCNYVPDEEIKAKLSTPEVILERQIREYHLVENVDFFNQAEAHLNFLRKGEKVGRKNKEATDATMQRLLSNVYLLVKPELIEWNEKLLKQLKSFQSTAEEQSNANTHYESKSDDEIVDL